MKPLLAVGVVAMGAFGLPAMRDTKTADPAPQATTRELAPLQLIQKMPVPGVAGRIDHFTAFPKRRLLIFAALGNNSMEILNTFQGKVVHSVKGLNEPQGVLYVPGLDKIFVANAGSGEVKVYDGKTYALRKTIELGVESDTDNLRWDEDSKRIFVGVVGGIVMIDAVTEARVGKNLKGSGGHSESFQIEKKGSRIFVNVPEDGSVVNVIDRKTGEMTKWGLNGVKANYPMALDEDDHRLFVVTRRPPLLMVLDTDTGKEVARVPRGEPVTTFITTRSASASMRSAAKDSSASSNKMIQTTMRFPRISPPRWVSARVFFMERAFTSACRHRDWNPRKYGITLCRSRVQGREFYGC